MVLAAVVADSLGLLSLDAGESLPWPAAGISASLQLTGAVLLLTSVPAATQGCCLKCCNHFL